MRSGVTVASATFAGAAPTSHWKMTYPNRFRSETVGTRPAHGTTMSELKTMSLDTPHGYTQASVSWGVGGHERSRATWLVAEDRPRVKAGSGQGSHKVVRFFLSR